MVCKTIKQQKKKPLGAWKYISLDSLKPYWKIPLLFLPYSTNWKEVNNATSNWQKFPNSEKKALKKGKASKGLGSSIPVSRVSQVPSIIKRK